MNKVVNSTVISNFASVQRLDLLRDTASSLFLPLEVYNEIQDEIADGGLTVADGNTLLRGMVERANYRSLVDDLQKLLP